MQSSPAGSLSRTGGSWYLCGGRRTASIVWAQSGRAGQAAAAAGSTAHCWAAPRTIPRWQSQSPCRYIRACPDVERASIARCPFPTVRTQSLLQSRTVNTTLGGTVDATVPDAVRGRIDEGAGPRAPRTLSATCAPHTRRHVRSPPRAPLAPRPRPPPSRSGVEPPLCRGCRT